MNEASAVFMFKLKVCSKNNSQKPVVEIEEIGGFIVCVSVKEDEQLDRNFKLEVNKCQYSGPVIGVTRSWQ